MGVRIDAGQDASSQPRTSDLKLLNSDISLPYAFFLSFTFYFLLFTFLLLYLFLICSCVALFPPLLGAALAYHRGTLRYRATLNAGPQQILQQNAGVGCEVHLTPSLDFYRLQLVKILAAPECLGHRCYDWMHCGSWKKPPEQ